MKSKTLSQTLIETNKLYKTKRMSFLAARSLGYTVDEELEEEAEEENEVDEVEEEEENEEDEQDQEEAEDEDADEEEDEEEEEDDVVDNSRVNLLLSSMALFLTKASLATPGVFANAVKAIESRSESIYLSGSTIFFLLNLHRTSSKAFIS